MAVDGRNGIGYNSDRWGSEPCPMVFVRVKNPRLSLHRQAGQEQKGCARPVLQGVCPPAACRSVHR